MAKSSDQRRLQELTVRMPIEEGNHFNAFHCDGSFTGVKADDVGALISISATRIDVSVSRETYRAVNDGGLIRQIAQSTLDSNQRKVIETTIYMRPDHALQMAAAILNQISQLNDGFKLKYNIPPIDVPAPGGKQDVI